MILLVVKDARDTEVCTETQSSIKHEGIEGRNWGGRGSLKFHLDCIAQQQQSHSESQTAPFPIKFVFLHATPPDQRQDTGIILCYSIILRILAEKALLELLKQ